MRSSVLFCSLVFIIKLCEWLAWLYFKSTIICNCLILMEIDTVCRQCPKFHWDHIFGKKISARKTKVKLERQIDHTTSDGKAKRKNRNDWGLNQWKTNEPQATLEIKFDLCHYFDQPLIIRKSTNQINRVKIVESLAVYRLKWKRLEQFGRVMKGDDVCEISHSFSSSCKCKEDKSVPHLVDSIHTSTMYSFTFRSSPLSTESRPSLWIHLKSLYLDRRGKALDWWWICRTCGWVVVQGSSSFWTPSIFFFANRQSFLHLQQKELQVVSMCWTCCTAVDL